VVTFSAAKQSLPCCISTKPPNIEQRGQRRVRTFSKDQNKDADESEALSEMQALCRADLVRHLSRSFLELAKIFRFQEGDKVLN